ncbi:inactive C-alpha-formylglycine-generating enzyme 2-like [Saccoglossus kowalevskii]|uniref:Sulfatase-modifying factor 2-like n=1 Tax=Saccoglossus kowalevskii TaxID=10224 RepID=A0ABM0MH13_SACKO|nr:PREDICTED: sulfatase-modifying factor 2-like [Saccoglossus kowalevskii]
MAAWTDVYRAGLVFMCVIILTESKTDKDTLTDADLKKFEEMVELKGGKFIMGTDEPNARDGEGPSRKVTVKPFKIMRYPVTNAAFRQFVKAKRFKTEAERFQWSFVFDAFVSEEVKANITERIPNTPWWVPVPRAYWRQPEGQGSTITKKLNWPAVHISANDAKQYCQWKGWRLPTEPEWEYAARGGLESKRYPWGARYDNKRMNIWQGKFPEENTKEDGYHGSSPVDAFEPQNDYGMYDMVGNLWEWTSTIFKSPNQDSNPENPMLVLRGGSYIDSKDGAFNHMARVTTRMGNTADAGSDNLGFRCASNVEREKYKPISTPPKGKKADSVKAKTEKVEL